MVHRDRALTRDVSRPAGPTGSGVTPPTLELGTTGAPAGRARCLGGLVQIHRAHAFGRVQMGSSHPSSGRISTEIRVFSRESTIDAHSRRGNRLSGCTA